MIFIYLKFNFNAEDYTKKFNFFKKWWKFIARRSPKLKFPSFSKINSLLKIKNVFPVIYCYS
nr:MAG TPA: hypothetical protein [Bacteriophage sp.]